MVTQQVVLLTQTSGDDEQMSAPVEPWARKHSLRPGAPPLAGGTPLAVGSRNQPAWQYHVCRRHLKSAGRTLVVPRTTAFPCQQAVVERLGSLSL